MLVEGKDKLGNLKLDICLDPTNLNRATVRELYHFKTPEDITHLIANCCVMTVCDACVMTVCDCKKGYWHQELDEASSFLTTFNTELGRFWYPVMPFCITVAGDVFQQNLDQCFSHIKNVIVIADDIVVVGKKQNHRDHDIALTALLDTARRCNIQLNYDKTPIQEKRGRLPWRNIHDQWMQTSTNQSICNNINARTKVQRGHTIFYRNG